MSNYMNYLQLFCEHRMQLLSHYKINILKDSLENNYVKSKSELIPYI